MNSFATIYGWKIVIRTRAYFCLCIRDLSLDNNSPQNSEFLQRPPSCSPGPELLLRTLAYPGRFLPMFPAACFSALPLKVATTGGRHLVPVTNLDRENPQRVRLPLNKHIRNIFGRYNCQLLGGDIPVMESRTFLLSVCFSCGSENVAEAQCSGISFVF